MILLSALLLALQAAEPVTASMTRPKAVIPKEPITGSFQSRLYDWGWYGSYPQREFASFDGVAVRPNLVKVDDRCDDSYLFLSPRGVAVDSPAPMILDNKGELIWTEEFWGRTSDLRVQQYMGDNYLTFWHGKSQQGSYVMLDYAYRLVKEVRPVGDFSGDMHDFQVTEQNTALFTIYNRQRADLSVFGLEDGWIYDSIFQEVDIASGNLLFEWRATDHFRPQDSLANPNGKGFSERNPFDFFRIDSIQKGPDGDYLVSAHHLSAVLGISHVDGSVLWQLGGRNNEFRDMSNRAATAFQWNHHVKWARDDGVLTMFDQGSGSAKMISLDFEAKTAELVREFESPVRHLNPSQGSVQVLPNGNILAGWGVLPAVTEFSVDGEVLCDMHFAPMQKGWVKNYRAYKFQWIGRPETTPDVSVDLTKEDVIYVSWNGATEVDAWLLESAPRIGRSMGVFSEHIVYPKTGFETKIIVPPHLGEVIRVTALDTKRRVMKSSKAIVPQLHVLAYVSRQYKCSIWKKLAVIASGLISGISCALIVKWLASRRRKASKSAWPGAGGHKYKSSISISISGRKAGEAGY